MSKHLLIGTALMLLASTGAWAADNAATATPAPAATASAPSAAPHKHHEWTLEEARKRAHARADKLDKMTEAEWEQKEQTRREHREKWAHMTPQEQEAFKKEHYGKRHKKADAAAPAASPAPVAQ